jgi:hypothetical protein
MRHMGHVRPRAGLFLSSASVQECIFEFTSRKWTH